MQLIHVADLHLGYRQYSVPQREADMQASFRYVLDRAVERGADAVLIPGDLFHRRDLRPSVLANTEASLTRVPDDVPVVVTPGNHDRNLTPRDVTWLEYLHERGVVTLLIADLDGETATFKMASDDRPRDDPPGFIDLAAPDLDGPVRVFGLQYRGGYTDTAIEQVAAGIRETNATRGEPAYTVLLGHFGINDVVPDLGADIRLSELAPLREIVDYLALGHIHKQYEVDDWIYNPGSPEAHDTIEARWDGKHGFYEVDVAADGLNARHRAGKRRPFYRLEFDVTDYVTASELETGFREELRDHRAAVEDICRQDRYRAKGSRRPPVIDLQLTGRLQFSRGALDTDVLSEMAAEELDALHVEPSVSASSPDVRDLMDELDEKAVFTDDGTLDTTVLEDEVFETIAQESRYGNRAADVADVLIETRELVTDRGEPPAEIADLLQRYRRDLFPDAARVADSESQPPDPMSGGDAT